MSNASDPTELEASSANTQALLARYRAGDRLALQVLVERSYSRITRMVRVRMGSRLLARESVEDVVQDVLLRVIQGMDSYEVRSDARWIDWVARLAQNEIANHVRREGAQKRDAAAQELRSFAESSALHELVADTTGVVERVARKEALAIVDQCVSELSDAQRDVILWRDYAGADWKTVAEEMGRPTPEACQELHRRARLELARVLASRV